MSDKGGKSTAKDFFLRQGKFSQLGQCGLVQNPIITGKVGT